MGLSPRWLPNEAGARPKRVDLMTEPLCSLSLCVPKKPMPSSDQRESLFHAKRWTRGTIFHAENSEITENDDRLPQRHNGHDVIPASRVGLSPRWLPNEAGATPKRVGLMTAPLCSLSLCVPKKLMPSSDERESLFHAGRGTKGRYFTQRTQRSQRTTTSDKQTKSVGSDPGAAPGKAN